MSDKPNAMELLEQASRSLTDARFNAMQGPLSAGQQAMVDGWAELRSRIDAYLAAPSESAMEILERVRLGGYALNANDPDDRGPNGDDYHFTFSDSDAAALIEDYAERETAALRGLVRRMRIAGNMVRDAMPNSVAVHNWIDVCAEADKVLGETTP